MIFLDDSLGTWIAARSRRELVDALLGHLPDDLDEMSEQRLAMFAAACLGHYDETTIAIRGL